MTSVVLKLLFYETLSFLSYRKDKLEELQGKKKGGGGMIDNLLSCGGRRGKAAKKEKQANMASRPLDNRQSQPKEPLPAYLEKNVEEISERCANILKDIVDAGCEVDKVSDFLMNLNFQN